MIILVYFNCRMTTICKRPHYLLRMIYQYKNVVYITSYCMISKIEDYIHCQPAPVSCIKIVHGLPINQFSKSKVPIEFIELSI